jgi:uncharacterized protein YkwD
MHGSREGLFLANSPTVRGALLAAALLLALLSTTASRASAFEIADSSPTATIAKVERTIVRCTNRERVVRGLPALRRNAVLRHAAKYHARNMLRYGFFRHQDPFGQSPADRVARFGHRGAFRWIGENIAVGTWSAVQTCRAWMASADHRANILNSHFTMIGVGFARGGGGRTYYVEDFGSAR